MRILWFSDAPWAATGYGVQTKILLPRLAAHGHEIAVATKHGLEGAVLHWCGCRIYPRGQDRWSRDVLAAHATHFAADLVVTLCDAWILPPTIGATARWVPWLPVDCDPLPAEHRALLAAAYEVVVFSRFGERVCADAGIRTRYAPLAVDRAVFRPQDPAAARERTGLPADRFVVGMVAANTDPNDRKAFVPQIRAFAAFRADHPDALLYLHAGLGDGERGIDLAALLDALGLELGRDVVVADPYRKLLGYAEREMADVYASLDVLLGCSSYEGFGVPLVEAQACGVPVIAGDWTSMPELVAAGWLVPATETEARLDPLRGLVRVPRVGALVEALERAYAGLDPVTTIAADHCADLVASRYWAPLLEDLGARIAESPRSFAEAVRA